MEIIFHLTFIFLSARVAKVFMEVTEVSEKDLDGI
jgi:hypothetical protein